LKPNIHPKYHVAQVTCACGNSWTTRSTRTQLRTDLCSACHPFFTGEQRIVDTAGQVDRFMRRMNRQNERTAQQEAQRAAAEAERQAAQQKTQRPARRPAAPAPTLESLLESTAPAAPAAESSDSNN
jgi:large subunit ribosomal protein L31